MNPHVLARRVKEMKIFEITVQRVKPMTAEEFLHHYISQAFQMIPELTQAFGSVATVEEVATLMLEAMIMSFEAITGKKMKDRVAREHVRNTLKKVYERRGIELPEELADEEETPA